ncbi:hypothetical protein OSSY52_10080 [Tepiditoga spiralis]|uniref:Solute-binding protein family 3/N-terminal domain-containing protein n=1 Tax=Tepiditoga spiralis TaxID=2108365 RepID=A0A7G1G7G1_9BACT|nr:transporter substrate-binding domain-containing protein [Tepiditoga spiralis]BBE30867.1 hypothetical protein OSSY52_10080 [Tepiditoga spiralis]
MKKVLFIIVVLFLSQVFQARTLKEIIDSGYLIIGIRNLRTSTIYQPENKENPGFCYELAKTYADYLNVKLKVHIVNLFSDYWKKDGELIFKSDKNVTPDIYNKVDIVADIITVTDKRKKYVNMIPFAENTELLFGRKESNIKKYEDLKGKKVLLLESMSFYTIFIDELKKRSIRYGFNKVYFEKDNSLHYFEKNNVFFKDKVNILLIPQDYTIPKFGFYYQVLLKNTDVSILDSFSFFPKWFNTYSLKENLKPLFPERDKIGYLSFCTSYETKELNKSLSNFISFMKKTDKYNLLFEKYIGIGYNDYKNILNVGD